MYRNLAPFSKVTTLSVLVGMLFIPAQSDAAVTFTKRTTGAFVTDGGLTRGLSSADYDGDGYVDLYACNSAGAAEANFLYHNNGDGTFTRVLGNALVDFAQNSDCASWGDYDNDGDLDVYVSTWSNQVNRLFSNNGDGTFTDEVGSLSVQFLTYSDYSAWSDYDRDGDLDLFVARGFNVLNNLLYVNDGSGGFSLLIGDPISADADRTHGCGWGDFDNDGWQDLFQANSSGQRTTSTRTMATALSAKSSAAILSQSPRSHCAPHGATMTMMTTSISSSATEPEKTTTSLLTTVTELSLE